MTLDEFLSSHQLACVHRPATIRLGQFWFNALAFANSAVVDKLPVDSDPFYDDSKLFNFWEWLTENWDA